MIKNISYIIIPIILLLLIRPLYNWTYYEYYDASKVYDYKSIKYRTGDLLLFNWQDLNIYRKSYYSFSIKEYFKYILHSLFDPGKFSHAGVVIVIDNIPYLYEYTRTSGYTTKKIKCHYKNKYISKTYLGTFLHPISNITKYLGDIWHLSYIGPPINKHKIFDTLKKYDSSLTYNIYSYPKCTIFRSKDGDENTHCSGFISRILNNFGITKIQNTNCISPSKLFRICIKSNLYEKKIKMIQQYI